ncbi:PDZ domain-containing protein [Paenibacillus crassostreae]|uniref:PDZ domain-containing protein n=1 Tax=Paenibacillus crassostreae TaxID=1763538 RepID=UPI000837DBAE|nr:serine protease [Paenibacillus crassostreae]
MDVALELLWNVTDALVQLLTQPFYYISILFILVFYRQQMLMERKLFHVRLHSWGLQAWRTVIGGLAAGIGVSIVMAFVGFSLTQEAIICIWVVTLMLLLIGVRYLCLAYTVGVLGVLQFILGFFPNWQPDSLIGTTTDTVRALDIPALVILVGILHLVEAILVKRQSTSLAMPLFIESKRGKLVGGFQMQFFWPLPLFLMIPAQTAGNLLSWTPLLGGEGWASGFSMLALPVMIGFSDLTQSMLPQNKAKITFKRLLFYSVILLLIGLLSVWWSPLMIVAALACFLLHMGMEWMSRIEEQHQHSLFVHATQGLRVLSVVPKSPADELGIVPGETVLKVNGVLLHSQEQLHRALRMNAAFCKLEILNLAGESKFLQRPMYAGDHHQLGVILAPDQDVSDVARLNPANIYLIIGMKLNTRKRSILRGHDSALVNVGTGAGVRTDTRVEADTSTRTGSNMSTLSVLPQDTTLAIVETAATQTDEIKAELRDEIKAETMKVTSTHGSDVAKVKATLKDAEATNTDEVIKYPWDR